MYVYYTCKYIYYESIIYVSNIQIFQLAHWTITYMKFDDVIYIYSRCDIFSKFHLPYSGCCSWFDVLPFRFICPDGFLVLKTGIVETKMKMF